jgi:hypothetical protein
MTWQLTKIGKLQLISNELKTFLSDKSHNWIPDKYSFVLPELGEGHFYLEDYSVEARKPAASIFYNKDYIRCFFDVAVAKWINENDMKGRKS